MMNTDSSTEITDEAAPDHDQIRIDRLALTYKLLKEIRENAWPKRKLQREVLCVAQHSLEPTRPQPQTNYNTLWAIVAVNYIAPDCLDSSMEHEARNQFLGQSHSEMERRHRLAAKEARRDRRILVRSPQEIQDIARASMEKERAIMGATLDKIRHIQGDQVKFSLLEARRLVEDRFVESFFDGVEITCIESLIEALAKTEHIFTHADPSNRRLKNRMAKIRETLQLFWRLNDDEINRGLAQYEIRRSSPAIYDKSQESWNLPHCSQDEWKALEKALAQAQQAVRTNYA